ncbi:hypothetical protein [Paenibacillus sp. CF384]|uniref:hypothetical protein n=1 Tax=Paenibacillus sp. CF384 TaxID=1884382 RepID=UPI0008958AC7|nr:hypothetical protein [Paenibacillus sp. CF384]SDW71451.1 hypothetical protein SAMN05518855_1004246 [Paenibacillus sp. CF384]
MTMVAEKIRCRCGTLMDTIEKDVSWIGSDGSRYVIRKVPMYSCSNHGCSEEYTSSNVQINVSILADEMRNGNLSKSTDYEERF